MGGTSSDRAWMPSLGRRISPCWMSTAATQLAVREGMAKAIPRAQGSMAVVIPTISPLLSRSGPPELPGLTEASVWMRPSSTPSRVGRSRWRALTTPRLTERSRPRGLPMATTTSPIRTRVWSGSIRVGTALHAARTTARSVRSSAPTSVPSASPPPLKRTRKAPGARATCELVTT